LDKEWQNYMLAENNRPLPKLQRTDF